MKDIVLLLFLFISASLKAQTNCDDKTIQLVSEHSVKNVYFFFRKTSLEKHKRIDKVIDENGTVLVQCKMKSKQQHDQYFIKEFKRIVITNGQIHEVAFNYKEEMGLLKIYNKCGQLTELKKLPIEILEEKYNFNSTML